METGIFQKGQYIIHGHIEISEVFFFNVEVATGGICSIGIYIDVDICFHAACHNYKHEPGADDFN